jgi:hypothetical protein
MPLSDEAIVCSRGLGFRVYGLRGFFGCILCGAFGAEIDVRGFFMDAALKKLSARERSIDPF